MNKELEDKIRERAYQLHLKYPENSDIENWLEAEYQITTEEYEKIKMSPLQKRIKVDN